VEARLVIVEGPDAGKEFELSGSSTVGREGDISLNDSEVSRSHASLTFDGSTCTVQDLGSTNGTYVNEERLTAARQLGPADKLRIGVTVFELRPGAQDDLQATAMRDVPDLAASAGPPGGAGGPPGGTPTGGPPPPSMPPPTPGPTPSASPPPAGSPPPAYAPPPAYGGAAPPPQSPGGLLAPSPYAAPAGAQLSGWWPRVGAALLDFLISLPFLIFIYVLVVSPILMARDGPNNGQTWGKQALGIKVVRDSGEPFSYGTALLRDFVVKSLLFGALAVVWLVDVLWPLWDEQNQALHDKLLGTHVLRT
jgi:uncharacterized RDD family membrane protein YckC